MGNGEAHINETQALPLRYSNESLRHQGLVVRQFNQRGFIRAINCPASCLTLITAEHASQLRAIEQAFTDGAREEEIKLSVSGRRLFKSEVFFAGATVDVHSSSTVWECIQTSGAANERIPELAKQVGLAPLLNDTVGSLEASARERLFLLTALFARSRVVLFRFPFKTLDRIWIPVFSQLMLDAAAASHQVYLVVGVDVIPKPWFEGQNAHIEVLGERRRRVSSFGGSGGSLDDIVSDVRKILQSNRGKIVVDQFLRTFPQRLHLGPVRVGREDTLRSEAIMNPAIEQLVSSDPKPEPAVHQDPIEHSLPKSQKGKLTRVSFWDRVSRLFFMGQSNKIGQAENGKSMSHRVPGSSLLRQEQRDQRIWFVMVVVTVLIIFTVVVSWFL